MDKKKRLAIFALVIALVMALSLTLFVACNPDNGSDDKPQTVEPTEDLLISNGDFKVLGGTKEDYPRSITDWSGARMYSGGSFPYDVVAGAIPLDPVLYNEFRKKWNDDGSAKITRGNGNITMLDALREKYLESEGEYSNPLMIYMPEKGTDLGVKDAEYGPTAYAYTSKSFSLEKGKYYKLSLDVMTYALKGVYNDKDELQNNPGARIYLSSETEAEFFIEDTNGAWETYDIYIEASAIGSTSLTIQLGLGKYTSDYQDGLTTGYAFFDNVTLTPVEAQEDGRTPDQIYGDKVAAQLNGAQNIQTASLKVPNGRFDYGSSTPSYSATPNGWSYVTGNKGSEYDDPAPSALGLNSIVDVTKFESNYMNFGKNYKVLRNGEVKEENTATRLEEIVDKIGFNADGAHERIGNNIFMISQQLMTAQGIQSNRSVTFEKNKSYALSIKVYTFDINGAGLTLLLSGPDGKDIAIEGISSNKSDRKNADGSVDSPIYTDGATTGGWVTYTFYIKGNQFRDYSYNMSIWLGTDGTALNEELEYYNYSNGQASDTSTSKTYNANGTFSTGWVFVDDLELKENVTGVDWSNALKDNGGTDDLKLDVSDSQNLSSSYIDLSTKNLFDGEIAFNASADNDNEYNDRTNGTPLGWKIPDGFTEPDDSRPVISPSYVNVGSVSLAKSAASFYENLGLKHPGTPYDILSENALMLQSSKDAYFEMESKNFEINPNEFYRLSMWVKTEDIKSSSGIYVYLMQQDGVDNDGKPKYKTAVKFEKVNSSALKDYDNDWYELVVYIRGANSGKTNMHLKVTLGTGTRWTSSTLASGAAFVTNLSMTKINYSAFNANSSSSSADNVKRESVNLYTGTTSNFTNGTFNNYDIDKTQGMEGGELSKNAAVPGNWSLSDSKLLENTGAGEENEGVIGGIVKMKDASAPNIPDGLYFEPSEQINNLFGASANKFKNLYGNPADADYTENLSRIGGPYMLALASLKNPKAFGFASDKFTLDSGGIYEISFWLKTFDSPDVSVYLTGETGGQSQQSDFTFQSSGTETIAEWTKYTYYIEVGLTSVSLQLNVWLGHNDKYFDLGENATEDDYLSKGIVLFDSVTKNSVEKEDFDAAVASDTVRKISYMTDGFDSVSSTIESRSKLTSPSGWTGSEDEEQDSKNTQAGAIYADDAFLETDTELGMTYVKILGPKLDLDEIKNAITSEEIEEAAKDYPEGTDRDKIRDELAEKKYNERFLSSMMPMSQLVPHNGNRMLIINNTEESAYFYSTSSGMTLKADSYYRISVFVRTYAVDQGKGAYIELYMGSANETVSDKPDSENSLIFKAVNTQQFDAEGRPVASDANDVLATNGWKQLTFYVKTLDDDVTGVKLKLGLGRYYGDEEDTLTDGYAMFDDVEIQTVEKDEFDSATASDTVHTYTVNPSPTEGSGDNGGTTETPSAPKFNLDYLWWMIPTILLGLATIIVVIVFAVRKFRKPKKAAFIEEAETSSEVIEEKRSNYDKNRE